MANLASEIKEKIDIAEVVGSYIKLEKAGTNFKARCPFHNEKTPSFFVSPKRNSYFCFGCGAKGDIFSFVQAIENIDFMGALKILADKAGIELKFESKENRDQKERLFECLEGATLFFERELQNNKEAKEYLLRRGLNEKTIKKWRLGFAPDGWHHAEEFLLSKGFSRDEMFRVGIIKKGEASKIYDVFRSRIMFPIFDSAGRTIAFSGRIFGQEEEGVAKYLNTPETEIFKKSEVFYGYNVAKHGIRKLGFAIIVEGQMDMLMSHQALWENTVASSGTALTENHLVILKRATDNLVIAYDSDKAGIKASFRAFEMALRAGFNVKACRIDEGKDPADLILKDPELFRQAIKESEPVISFFWKNLLKEDLNKERLLKRFRQEIVPLLVSEKRSAERQRIIAELGMTTKLGIREDLLMEEILKFKIDPQEEVSNQNVKSNNVSPLKDRVFGLLFAVKGGSIKNNSDLDIEKELGLRINDWDRIYKEAELEKERLQFEAEVFWSDGIVEKKEIIELLDNFEEDCLKSSLSDNMNKLGDAEKQKNGKVDQILKEIQEISKKLAKIRDQGFNNK